MTFAACAEPRATGSAGSGAGQSSSPAGPRRLTVAIAGQPVSVSQAVTRATLAYTAPGGEFVETLVNRGLTLLDDHLEVQPDLAEAVPSIENGLWVLHPEGGMDTT